jgi:hypothetical protein
MSQFSVSLTELLAKHRMCLACLAVKARTSTQTLEVNLEALERSLPVRRKSRTCPFCGVPGTVYSLDAPKPTPSRISYERFGAGYGG